MNTQIGGGSSTCWIVLSWRVPVVFSTWAVSMSKKLYSTTRIYQIVTNKREIKYFIKDKFRNMRILHDRVFQVSWLASWNLFWHNSMYLRQQNTTSKSNTLYYIPPISCRYPCVKISPEMSMYRSAEMHLDSGPSPWRSVGPRWMRPGCWLTFTHVHMLRTEEFNHGTGPG